MEPLLIAETPRASNDGHRFLVPKGSNVSESKLAAFVGAALDAPDGGNYLGASRQATQSLDNGAVRVGREVLVIAGVDVARLAVPRALDLQRWLHAKLEGLHELTMASSSQRLVIEQPEFNQWLEELVSMGLPTIDLERGPRALATIGRVAPSSTRSRTSTVVGVVAAHVATLLIGGLVVWFLRDQFVREVAPSPKLSKVVESPPAAPRKVTPVDTPPATEKAPAPSIPESLVKEIEETIKGVDQNLQAEVCDLLKTASSNPSHQRNDLGGKMIECVNELNDSPGNFGKAERLVILASKILLPEKWATELDRASKEFEDKRAKHDENLYEAIKRDSTVALDDPAKLRKLNSQIDDYLRLSTRGSMADEVKAYRVWLRTAPRIEIKKIGSSDSVAQGSTESCEVEVSIAKRMFTIDGVPFGISLEPSEYSIDLEALNPSPWFQNVDIRVTQKGYEYNTCWILQPDGPPTQIIHASRKKGFGHGYVDQMQINLYIPKLESRPTLPEWKENSDE